jgi:hypothetical protein
MIHAADLEAPLVLAIPEVARLIGRSELATRRAIQRGHLPARKLGGRVVILRAELVECFQHLPLYGVEEPAE